VRLLDHIVVLRFGGNFILFSTIALQTYIPTNGYKSSHFSRLAPAFVIFWWCSRVAIYHLSKIYIYIYIYIYFFFDSSHSNWGKVTSYFGLVCIFVMISHIGHFFHTPIGQLYIFFWEMFVHVFCLFLIGFFFCCQTAWVPYMFRY
jgi:hypothetical protein